jgi:hypothetical protein
MLGSTERSRADEVPFAGRRGTPTPVVSTIIKTGLTRVRACIISIFIEGANHGHALQRRTGPFLALQLESVDEMSLQTSEIGRS